MVERKKVPVSYGTCIYCEMDLKSKVVTVTYKGFIVSRRSVLYCPNNDCPQENVHVKEFEHFISDKR